MATITMPSKKESAEESAPEVKGQARPREQRFLLKVDRQMKRSYAKQEDALKDAKAIKKAHPVTKVQVSDTQEGTETLVE